MTGSRRAATTPTFLVLDGQLRILVGDEEHHAGRGAVAVLPRRLRHAYVVTSPDARFVTFHSPAGFEEFARDVGEPAAALELPPESVGLLPDTAALSRAAARYGLTTLGPPPKP